MAYCRSTTASIALIGSGGRRTPHHLLVRHSWHPIPLALTRRQPPTRLVLRFRRRSNRRGFICSRILNQPAVRKTHYGHGVTDGTGIGAAVHFDDGLRADRGVSATASHWLHFDPSPWICCYMKFTGLWPSWMHWNQETLACDGVAWKRQTELAAIPDVTTCDFV